MLDKVLNTPATSSSTSPSVFVSVNISLFHRIKFAETYLVGDVIFFIVLFYFVLFCCFFSGDIGNISQKLVVKGVVVKIGFTFQLAMARFVRSLCNFFDDKKQILL